MPIADWLKNEVTFDPENETTRWNKTRKYTSEIYLNRKKLLTVLRMTKIANSQSNLNKKQLKTNTISAVSK